VRTIGDACTTHAAAEGARSAQAPTKPASVKAIEARIHTLRRDMPALSHPVFYRPANVGTHQRRMLLNVQQLGSLHLSHSVQFGALPQDFQFGWSEPPNAQDDQPKCSARKRPIG
jgi:hypothetical protein